MAVSKATAFLNQAFGGQGAGVAPPGSSTSTQSSSSGSYFSDPGRVKTLSDLLSGVVGNSASYFNDYIKDPTQSPLFKTSLASLLTQLQPGEAASRQALRDEFLMAGATNSGAFANATRQNESDILANRGNTGVNLLNQQFAPTLQGLLGGIGQGNPLIDALKLDKSESTSKSVSQGFAPAGSQLLTPRGFASGPNAVTRSAGGQPMQNTWAYGQGLY